MFLVARLDAQELEHFNCDVLLIFAPQIREHRERHDFSRRLFRNGKIAGAITIAEVRR
jgi:hypothetical protein